MSLNRRPDITEEVRDSVVRDYLRGDKTIIIQMEYKISPGVMYRILHARQVSLRTEDHKPEPVVISPQLPEGSGFRVALWNLTLESWYWDWNDTFTKMGAILAEYLEKEPYITVEALGFLNQAFSPEDLVKRALEMIIENVCSFSPEFERIGDGTWRLWKIQEGEQPMNDEEKVWVRDTSWVKLDTPKRCRSIAGSPRTHCPNMAEYGFPRSNGIWAYCEEHMYGRRIRDGIVEYAVHPDSPAAKRGYA